MFGAINSFKIRRDISELINKRRRKVKMWYPFSRVVKFFRYNMNKIVKIFYFVVFLSVFGTETDASERSISENFENNKEMSLLYNKDESLFIKDEVDLKLFALRESYKSHLYTIRHSSDTLPMIADYTDARYAETVYTKIPTALVQFALTTEQTLPILPNTLTDNDVKVLHLDEFIDTLKKAKSKNSLIEFLNEIKNVFAKRIGNTLFLDISYDNIGGTKKCFFFKVIYESSVPQKIERISGGYPTNWHGLINMEGTCYCSALMHFLNASQDFRNFIEDAAKIYRRENMKQDNIFVILHNIFNLINSNISLIGEADDVSNECNASSYSKKMFDKQFYSLVKELDANQEAFDKQYSALIKQFNEFIKKTWQGPQTVAIYHNSQILLYKIWSAMQVRVGQDANNSALQYVWNKMASQLSIMCEDVTKCNECGYEINRATTVYQMMTPYTNEETGEISNEEISKCFRDEISCDDLKMCNNCKRAQKYTTIKTSNIPGNFIICPVAKDMMNYCCPKLLKDVIENPNNQNKYAIRASLLYKVGENPLNHNENHATTLIKHDDGYFIVDNDYVGNYNKDYKEIVQDKGGHVLLLYEKVDG